MPSSSKLAASACRQDHGLVAVRIPMIRLAVTLRRKKIEIEPLSETKKYIKIPFFGTVQYVYSIL